MTTTVRNKKTGKIGTLIKEEGSRIQVAYGNLKVWANRENFEFLNLEHPKKTVEAYTRGYRHGKEGAMFAPPADYYDEYRNGYIEGCNACTDNDPEPDPPEPPPITCPFCKETIITIEKREVCGCTLTTCPAPFAKIFHKAVSEKFVSIIRHPDATLEEIGDRYRWKLEADGGEYLDWKQINNAITERFGWFPLRLIQEFVKYDDMPYFDPDEVAFRIASEIRPEPPAILSISMCQTTGVTWENKKWKSATGMTAPPIPKMSTESGAGWRSEVSG